MAFDPQSKIAFKSYARRATYRRLAAILAPVGLLMLGLGLYLGLQLAVGQQQRVVSALSQTLSANVMNGDSFQLKSLAVSAVRSGLFAGIKIEAQGQVIASAGTAPALTGGLPLVFGASGLDVGQRLTLDGVADGWVLVSNHFSWLLIVGSLLGPALALLSLLYGAVRATQLLAADLATPLTGLAKAISAAGADGDQQAAPPCGQHFAEVDEVWNRHTAVVAQLRVFLQGEAEAKKNAATARMTQMLAHDVRKPFSILRMGLGMLGSAKDHASVKRVLTRLLPEIDKAVSSVDGLIADVMEVGSTSTGLIQEPVSPESLIESTLSEIFRVYPKADVTIGYDFRHTHMANVHVQKVRRVFSNIVGNAIQAMGQRGEVWFKTREHDGMIEFSVGNAGSVIPAASLPKLFDAFFTSGKKGGTGLGLAIAKKVVTAHGGKIWCHSDKTLEHPDGQVEFIFTLPITAGHLSNPTDGALPRRSADITAALEAINIGDDQVAGSIDKGELTLEENIAAASAKLGRPLRVLVVDDEAVYRNALGMFLSRTPALAAAIEVTEAQDSASALGSVAAGAFDLVITDVDMGTESLDGFELVEQMREQELKAMVCVHSNRIVAADHRTALNAGADAFLPKPVARAQLLRLVLQAAEATQPTAPAGFKRQGANGSSAAAKAKPELLVVDDNIFVVEAWESAIGDDAVVHGIASLEELSERLEADPGFTARLLLAVTDMHLGGSVGDGLDVGRLLKKHRPGLRVLLSSDGVIPAADLVGAIDAAIGKDPVVLPILIEL